MSRKELYPGRRAAHAQAARSSAHQIYRDQMAQAKGAYENEVAKISDRYQKALARIAKRFSDVP